MIASSDSFLSKSLTVLVLFFSNAHPPFPTYLLFPSLSVSANHLPLSFIPSTVLYALSRGVYTGFVKTHSPNISLLFLQLTDVLFYTVDRSGTGQSGSSPRVTLRLNQVRGARDEKKGGGAANSRQGGMNAQVYANVLFMYIYTYISNYVYLFN